MDPDPEDGYHIIVTILDDSAIVWTVDGIRQKKED